MTPDPVVINPRAPVPADVTDQFYSIAEDVKLGYGAQLLVGVGNTTPGPEDFVAVAGVVQITFGELNTAIIDITHLRSLNAAHEKAAGMRDFTAFAVKCRWLPNHQTQKNDPGDGAATAPGLLALNISRAITNFQIKLNDADESTYPFAGIVTKYKPGDIGADTSIDLDVEITPVNDYTAGLGSLSALAAKSKRAA